MLLKFFNFFIFSSLFIAGCSLLMIHQTDRLLHLQYEIPEYMYFVFFSTVCSYNFHWYLTPQTHSELIRVSWTNQHRTLHLALIAIGTIGSIWFAIPLLTHWFWLGIAAVLTFLYSAPKLPVRFSGLLKKIAVGKTIFLSFVWTYVTAVLPVILDGDGFNRMDILFCASRLFLIYSICIIFDYRDREQDKIEGIRSMITAFDEKGINRLFYTCITFFFITTIVLYFSGFSVLLVFLLAIPGIITAMLYSYAKTHFSDYLYYFVLDGLMMFSALFTAFISF